MINHSVLVTGAGGMLGNAIVPYFRERYSSVHATDKVVSEPWLTELDVRDQPGLAAAFERVRPKVVLHLAAETDLEFCETNPEVAYAVNRDGTRNVARLAQEFGATLVYISTAGVFDGVKDGLYTEDDTPRPIMVYGQSKLDGEHEVARLCADHYIVRAGWMVGGGTKDHKFVSLMLEQLAKGARTLRAVDDRWGTPTYTHDFANNLFRLLDTGRNGLYHMVCEGFGTRYDVAREILRVCRREDDVELLGVPSEYFKETYFAPRPRSEMMRNARLEALGLNLMRPWRAAMRDYLVREFSHALRDGVAGGWDGQERRGPRPCRRVSNAPYYGPERRQGDRRQALPIAA